MEILGKLFGGESRVRIIRLFLFNPGRAYGLSEIADRAKVQVGKVKKDMTLLWKAQLVKAKPVIHFIEKKKGNKVRTKKIKEAGWVLNEHFPYLTQLQSLVIHTVLVRHDAILKKLNKAGKIKLVIVAGVFLQDADSRIDILIVGDNLRQQMLEGIIRGLEAEIGKELRYSVFETADFQYRLGMYDKLVRDVLDFPHQKIVDKLGVPDTHR